MHVWNRKTYRNSRKFGESTSLRAAPCKKRPEREILSDEKAIRESLNETVQSKTQVYHGRVANIDVWDVTLPDGRSAKREIIRHPGAAAVVPVDRDGCVTMVYQYRHPLVCTRHDALRPTKCRMPECILCHA